MSFRQQFQTPPEFCRYMASLIPAGVVTVLEPTRGNGNLVAELNGYVVTAPDDYFLLDKHLRFDCVIMNPPFSTKHAILTNAPPEYSNDKGMKIGYKMLQDCMRKSDNVIALMPWFTLTDSDVRLREMKKFGLKSITALPRRTFEYIRIQVCVLCFQKGYKGPTETIVYDLLKEDNQLLMEI